jgi:nucleoside-diphosphate-sugar epimerase
MSKFVITGVTGQVGAAIAAGLVPGHEVWGLARYTAPGSYERVEALGVRPVVCDFTTGDFTGVPGDADYVLQIAAATRATDAEDAMAGNADGTALLMGHSRRARAFLYMSTADVYYGQPDPFHVYAETDRLGGHADFPNHNYGPTKLAAEGVVRGLALVLGIPSVITRLDAAYGTAGDGGSLGHMLDTLARGKPVVVPDGPPLMMNPIHDDALVAQVEPMLAAAGVPATIVNWGGDDVVSTEDCVRYMGELTGIEPTFRRVPGVSLGWVLDNTRRRRLVGDCQVGWQEGVRSMVAARHPELLGSASAG